MLERMVVALSLHHRRESAVGRTDPAVIPAAEKVAPDQFFELGDWNLPAVKAAVEQLFLHPCPHTLTACVVMAASSGAVHALDEIGFLNGPAVQLAGILAAAVGVENRTPKSRIGLDRVFYRSGTQRSFHVGIHSQTQDGSVIAVKNGRNIELSIPALDFRNVGHTLLQRFGAGEIPFQEVVGLLGHTVKRDLSGLLAVSCFLGNESQPLFFADF